MNAALKKYLFGTIMTAFVILVIEIICYIYMYHIMDNPLGNDSERHLYSYFRGHELNPEYHRQFDTFGQKIHSSDGFRSDTSYSVTKPDNVYRIILFGGSQAYGIGSQHGGVYPPNPSLKNDQTSSYHLEKLLNEHAVKVGFKKKIEIINASVVAYKIYQHLIYFNERLYMYEPDLVVFLDGHNDFYSNEIDRNPMLSNHYAKELVYYFNKRSFLFSIYTGFRFFGEYSYFAKFIEKSLQKILPKIDPYESTFSKLTPGSLDRYEEYAKNNYIRIYKQFENLSTIYGFKTQIFFQPEILLENKNSLSSNDQIIYDITSKYSDVTMKNEIHSKLKPVFDKFKVSHVDLTSIADGNLNASDLYMDYTHLTPAGSKLLAKKMAQELEKSIFSSASFTSNNEIN